MESTVARLLRSVALVVALAASGALLGWVTEVGMMLQASDPFWTIEGAFGTQRAVGAVLWGPFAVLAAAIGGCAGLALSPLVLFDREQGRLRRALVSVLLSLPVACLSGATLMEYGPLLAVPLVAVSVVGAYAGTRGRRRGRAPDARIAWRTAMVAPLVTFGVLALLVLSRRLPSDPGELLPIVGESASVRSEGAANRLLEVAGAEGLTRALSHPSPTIRERVARAAQNFRSDGMEPVLLGALTDPVARVRETAYHSLLHLEPDERTQAAMFVWAVDAEREGWRERRGYRCSALKEEDARVLEYLED